MSYDGRSTIVDLTTMTLNHDALLGMDFLEQMNATIDVKGRRIVLGVKVANAVVMTEYGGGPGQRQPVAL